MVTQSRRRRRLLILLSVIALIAASCSSSGDSEAGSGGGGGGGGGDNGGTGIGPEGGPEFILQSEDLSLGGEPVPGGKLIYGVEADTGSPWTPAAALCAISCHTIMKSVFDTALVVNEDLEVEGFIVESFEPNEDFTSWTFTAREGIEFHDGTPLDGAAIAANLEAHQSSVLTGTVLRDSEEITSDGMSATITFSKPWAHFPLVMTGQVGYIASPTWLAAVKEDSSLAQQPVGTGPFVFKSYAPGAQAVYVGTKNPNYWLEGLPYLDEIEFRSLNDSAALLQGVQRGQVDIMHTSGGLDIQQAEDAGGVNVIKTGAYSETSYLLLHVGDEEHEVSDVRVRRAMAFATDRALGVERRTNNFNPIANGPFNPSQIGYLEDTGYPKYDPDEARRLVDEYEAENGPINITVKTTVDPQNAETVELLRSQWQEVGIDSDTEIVPQDQLVIDAVFGNFEAELFRQHGGTHPDTQNHWWHSDVADSGSPLIINFGRIRDEVIDENLDKLRASDDPAVVKEAAEAISRQFGEQAYNLWGWWSIWGIVSQPNVKNITGFELPSGNKILPFGMGIGGSHWLSQIWIDESA